jgi:hypothetical protein
MARRKVRRKVMTMAKTWMSNDFLTASSARIQDVDKSCPNKKKSQHTEGPFLPFTSKPSITN